MNGPHCEHVDNSPNFKIESMSIQDFKDFRAEIIALVRQSEAKKDRQDWKKFIRERKKL